MKRDENAWIYYTLNSSSLVSFSNHQNTNKSREQKLQGYYRFILKKVIRKNQTIFQNCSIKGWSRLTLLRDDPRYNFIDIQQKKIKKKLDKNT